MALRAYQQVLPDIKALGGRVVAVSPEKPDRSRTIQEKHSLSFEVLSDAGNPVARSYGLVFSLPEVLRGPYAKFGIDLPEFNGDESFELPVPATFVIDADRKIQWRHFDTDYTARAEPSEILAALKSL